MQNLNSILTTKTKLNNQTIVNKYIKNNCYINITKLYYQEVADLTNPEENLQYKGFYTNIFYKLGREKVLQLAGEARSNGRDPQKYFSLLLIKASS